MESNQQEQVKKLDIQVKPNVAEVWQCQSDNCNGWMRKSFSLEEAPVCPICQSEMKSTIREIPIIKKKMARKSIAFGRGLKH
jgi:hypothetical protein